MLQSLDYFYGPIRRSYLSLKWTLNSSSKSISRNWEAQDHFSSAIFDSTKLSKLSNKTGVVNSKIYFLASVAVEKLHVVVQTEDSR